MAAEKVTYEYVLTTLVQTPYERRFPSWPLLQKHLEFNHISLGWQPHHAAFCNMRTCAEVHTRAIVESNELVKTHTLERAAL